MMLIYRRQTPLLHNERIRVLEVVSSLNMGGTETFLRNLVLSGLLRGYDFSFCRREGLLCAYDGDLKEKRIPVYEYGRGLARTVRDIESIVRRAAPDIVHVHTNFGAPLAALGARRAGCSRVVAMFHGPAPPHFKSPAKRWFLRAAFLCASLWLNVGRVRITVCSKAVAKALHRTYWLNSRRAAVFYLGVDLSRFRRDPCLRHKGRQQLCIPEHHTVVGTVASLTSVKRQTLMLQVFWRVCKTREEHLVLVGDGPCRGEIEREAKRLGVANKVHLVGCRKDVEVFLNAFDIFLLTSSSEGIPVSMIEAMATEVPIITTDVGGVREALGEGPGMLVGVHDVPAMCGALRTLLESERIWRRMGVLGRRRAEEMFSLQSCARRFDALMKSVMAK